MPCLLDGLCAPSRRFVTVRREEQRCKRLDKMSAARRVAWGWPSLHCAYMIQPEAEPTRPADAAFAEINATLQFCGGG